MSLPPFPLHDATQFKQWVDFLPRDVHKDDDNNNNDDSMMVDAVHDDDERKQASEEEQTAATALYGNEDKHPLEILKQRSSLDPTETNTTTTNLSLSEYQDVADFMDFSNDGGDDEDWQQDLQVAVGLEEDHQILLPNDLLLLDQDTCFLQEGFLLDDDDDTDPSLSLLTATTGTESSAASAASTTLNNTTSNTANAAAAAAAADDSSGSGNKSSTTTTRIAGAASAAASQSSFQASLQLLLETRRAQLAATMQASQKTRMCLEPHIKQRASLASVLSDIEKSSRKIQQHLLHHDKQAATTATTTTADATTDKKRDDKGNIIKSAPTSASASVPALDAIVEGSHDEENGGGDSDMKDATL